MAADRSLFPLLGRAWHLANYAALMVVFGTGLYSIYVTVLPRPWALGIAISMGAGTPLAWRHR